MTKSFKKEIASVARNAIQTAGGPSNLAKSLSDLRRENITPWRVQKWIYNGVAPKFVLDVETITNISRTKLRPDYYPDEDQADRIQPSDDDRATLAVPTGRDRAMDSPAGSEAKDVA